MGRSQHTSIVTLVRTGGKGDEGRGSARASAGRKRIDRQGGRALMTGVYM